LQAIVVFAETDFSVCVLEGLMMKIKLPLMTMSTALDAALSNLRQSKRAALLSEQGGAYHLFSAASIVVGRSLGIKTLGELKADPRSASPQVVMRLATKPETGRIVGSEREGRLRSGRVAKRKAVRSTAKEMMVTGGNYVISSIAGKSAFVGLLDTDLAAKYVSSPADCYCDGPRHHDSFPKDVRDGDPCPYKDGHTIVCAR
jgi:hypothetical protein